MLSFPDELAATLELVHGPGEGPMQIGGFDHLAVQVDDVTATQATLIELVEWPPGYPYGLTAADFADQDGA